MSDDEERTEEATQQRREDFRKRGQVAQTRELGSVFILLTSALMFWLMGRFFLEQCSEMVTQTLGSFVLDAARKGNFLPATFYILKRGIFVMGPLVCMLAIMSVASTVVQVGLLTNDEAFDFNLAKLNPIAGFGKLFSLQALVEGFKSLLKLVVITGVLYLLLKDHTEKIPSLVALDMRQLVVFIGDVTLRLLGGVGIFLAVIAAADYFFQWWTLEKQMRMTKQEIKEEHKSREGDPMIKARIRRIQRERAQKRMITNVPKATVIVTNPTHIACALRYDPETMAAPILVAKGADNVAEKIKEIARLHNIPIMENVPLARAMFKTMKLGQMVPRELFTAVAQVLSYIYKLKRKAWK